MKLYAANPSEATDQWLVWDMYASPLAIVFLGTMEDAGLVADALNAREGRVSFETLQEFYGEMGIQIERAKHG